MVASSDQRHQKTIFTCRKDSNMQYVYIMCSYKNAVALSRTLKAHCREATIVEAGYTDKLELGYVVLRFPECVPDGFPALLDVNNDVSDFSVYTEEICHGK